MPRQERNGSSLSVFLCVGVSAAVDTHDLDPPD